MKVLAIDYGLKRTGFAISDEKEDMIFNYNFYRMLGSDQDIKNIVKTIKDSGAGEVVVGLPRRMDNTIGSSAKKVLDFVEVLKEKLEIPIATWDERLTSEQAGKMLAGLGLSRKKKKEKINVISARIILESYLEYKKRKTNI